MTDIFSETPQQETQEENSPSLEQIIDQRLKEIKREDGSQMFDSVEKALESLSHAQKIIPELKSNLKAKEEEATDLKTQLEKAATVEDVLSRITETTRQPEVNTEVSEVKNNDIGELVKKELNNFREQEQISSNRKQVNDALVGKFGDAEKAKLALDNKAQELGVTTEFLASIADKSPKALLNYFESTPSSVSQPTTTSVNLRKGTDTGLPHQLEEFSITKTKSKDQVDIMKQIKDNVYSKWNVVAN